MANKVSLRDVVLYNERLHQNALLPEDKEAVYEGTNLYMTRNQLMDLPKEKLSVEPNYDARLLSFSTGLKKALDDEGFVVSHYRITGKNNDELSAVVNAGATQAQIVLLSSEEGRLGLMHVNGKAVYRNKSALQNINNRDDAVANMMMPIRYMLGSTTNEAHVRPTASSDGATLQVKTKVSSRSGSDGVFYVAREDQYKRESQKQMERLKDSLGPQTFYELVEQSYLKENQSVELIPEEYRKPDQQFVDFNRVLDADGQIDIRRVNMDVLIRHNDMADLVAKLKDEQRDFVSSGKGSTKDFNQLLMTELSEEELRLEQEAVDYHKQQVEEETENEVTINPLADALSAAGIDELIVNNDELLQNDEDGGELDAPDVVSGSRQRVANFLVGNQFENGEPVSGRLSPAQYTSEHLRMIEVARRAAEQTGVEDFDAFYDNDQVMHWRGTHLGEPVSHQLGQFFFPSEEDQFDENGELMLKKGVIQTQYGSGVDQLRVSGYRGTFVSPNPEKLRKDGSVNGYRHNLITRLKLEGLNQDMTRVVASSVKTQVLTRSNVDPSDVKSRNELYDTTRLRKLYQDTTKLDHKDMIRPGVVEQAKATVRFDSSWLGRENELREKEVQIHQAPLDGQSIRNSLKGLEGVFDEEASSDGKILGLKRVLTKQFEDFLEEHGGALKFKEYGTLGPDGTNAKGEKTLLQSEFLDVPEAVREKMRERYPQLKDESDPIKYRQMYECEMADRFHETYGQYDSPDRKMMAMNMVMVANNVVGGQFDTEHRDKVNVALMTAGGQTFEDSIIVSKEAAEKYNWRIGDKLADMHSNKGVIGYIGGLDKDDPNYNADVEQFFEQNPKLEMIQSPYGPASRANMGLIKELQNSKEIDEVKDRNGETQGYMGQISVITTNMDAEHKVKLYGLQDLGRMRHFSYQQMYAIEAHGAEGVLNEVFKYNEREHETLSHYMNAVGVHTEADGSVVSGHLGMKQVDTVTKNDLGGYQTIKVEQPSDKVLTVSPEDALIAMPTGPAYLELPLLVPVNQKNDLQSRYVPIVPDRLRKDSTTFDGQYVEHDYQHSLEKIANLAQSLERMKFEGIYESAQNQFIRDDMIKKYEERDPEFMHDLAVAEFDETDKDYKSIQLLETQLKQTVANYEQSVMKDQFGTDARGIKQSYIRRHIVSADMPNSATVITTNNVKLPIDTLGMSPAVAANLGLVEAIDKERAEKAIQSGDMHQIQEAYRGNWKMVEGKEDTRVMAWRDPILHDGSVSGFKCVIDERLTGVAINPLVTTPMALDFDGDQLGLYCPTSKKAQTDLRTKMNITNNLINARGDIELNIGMDNIDYFTQDEWSQKKLQALKDSGQELNGKALLNVVLDRIQEKSEDVYEQVMNTHMNPEQRAYYQVLNEKRVNTPEALTAEDKEWLKPCDKIEAVAFEKKNDAFAKDMSNFTEKYFANEVLNKNRCLDFRSDELAIESLRDMADNGAKGNTKSIDRAAKYLKDGVTYDDRVQVRSALSAKVDLTGQAGAQMLRLSPLMAEKQFLVDGRVLNGAKLAMDLAEQPTQKVLQIKHSPADVPEVKEYLQDSRRFSVGPSEENPSGRVLVRLDPDHIESLTASLPENSDSKRISTAQQLDKALGKLRKFNEESRDSGYDDRKILYADINNGYVSDNFKKDGEPLVELKLDAREVYALSYKAIHDVNGLNATYPEVDAVQSVVRDPQTGLMKPYDQNFYENASTVDILAQRGAQGLRKVSHDNDAALNEGRLDQVKRMGSKHWDKFTSADYSRINDHLDQQYVRSKEQYQLVIPSFKEAVERQKEHERERMEELRLSAAQAAGLDVEPAVSDVDDLLEHMRQSANVRSHSINLEMNDKPHSGPNVIDTQKGPDNGELDSVRREAINDKIVQEMVGEYRRGTLEMPAVPSLSSVRKHKQMESDGLEF